MNLLHRVFCKSDRWRKTIQQRVLWAISSVDLGQDVLEIGPGSGLTTDVMRKAVHRLTVLEIEPVAAEALRSRLPNTNVDVVTGDATSMPFPDSKFSGCVSFTMLHHVPSRELQDQLLRETWRVLKPGEMFVGTDSLPSTFMNLIHIGDTMVLVDPDTVGARLKDAGFLVLSVGRQSQAFRFYARRPSE